MFYDVFIFTNFLIIQPIILMMQDKRVCIAVVFVLSAMGLYLYFQLYDKCLFLPSFGCVSECLFPFTIRQIGHFQAPGGISSKQFTNFLPKDTIQCPITLLYIFHFLFIGVSGLCQLRFGKDCQQFLLNQDLKTWGYQCFNEPPLQNQRDNKT